MVKEFESIGSRIEDLKNISVCDLFYKVVFDIVAHFQKSELATNSSWLL
jgi:hypothetical protein